jgi:hypothetical protein
VAFLGAARILANLVGNNPMIKSARRCYITFGSDYRMSSWEYIQRIGKAPVFGSIIFFPVVSAALRIEGNVQILFFPMALGWKMHLLYWGLFCLFVGSILFTWHCPGMFKRFATHHDYAKSQIETLSIPVFALNSAKFVGDRLEEHSSQVRQFEKNHIDNLKVSIKSVEQQGKLGESIPVNIIAEFMLCHWKFMNRSLPRWRVAIALSYGVGLSFLVVVSAASFAEILCYYIRKIL